MAGINIGGSAFVQSPVIFAYVNLYFGGGTDTISGMWLLTDAGPEFVTDPPVGSPAASQDGSQVAFQGTSNDLYIVDRGGGGLALLDNTLTSFAMSWHPDGSKILYRVGFTVRTIEPDGSNQTDILFQTGLQAPCYSFDGSRIAYVIQNSGTTPDELWVMDADGTNATQVAVAINGGGVRGTIGQPSWAKTQDVMVYQKSNGVGAGTTSLYTINGDGTGETAITAGNTVDSVTANKRSAWAPDDSVIAATGDAGATVYTVDPSGGGVTSLGLTQWNSGTAGPEIWGNRIYYISDLLNLMSCALDGTDVVKEDGDDSATYACDLQDDFR